MEVQYSLGKIEVLPEYAGSLTKSDISDLEKILKDRTSNTKTKATGYGQISSVEVEVKKGTKEIKSNNFVTHGEYTFRIVTFGTPLDPIICKGEVFTEYYSNGKRHSVLRDLSIASDLDYTTKIKILSPIGEESGEDSISTIIELEYVEALLFSKITHKGEYNLEIFSIHEGVDMEFFAECSIE